MAGWRILLRCVGEAVGARGLKALAGAVPFGEALYDIAAEALERWRNQREREDDRACLEAAAQAALAEVRAEAQQIAAAVAPQLPAEQQAQFAAYLLQVPARIRQTLRRPEDATGQTAPAGVRLARPEDVLALLPPRPPRFCPGDRPAGIGDWELVEMLGMGGFGEVWKARHRYFDGIAPVALKFCLDPTARDRLLHHEAHVLNQVMRHGRHPGIVALLDASLSSDPPCLRYEFIEGGDLASLIRSWQDLAPAERWQPAAWLVKHLAEIVGHAHRLKSPIVHRDLKPANILLPNAECRMPNEKAAIEHPLVRSSLSCGNWQSAFGHVKITDFGIGAVAALPALRESRQGTVTRGDALATALRGAYTPLYASPQQQRGDPPDPRDDVHALGVIWYQLLTADPGTGAPTGLWAEELEEAGMRRELIRLLGACVAGKAEKRPADGAALAEQLAGLLEGAKPAASPPPPSPTPEPPPIDPLVELLEANPSSWLLDLTNKGIGDAGLQRLAKLPSLARRSVLILAGNQITNAGVTALAASPNTRNLTRLVLWDNLIGDAGARALAGSEQLANLTVLDLGKNRIGDAGVEALAASPHLGNLGALILVSNQIGDAGARALAASPYLANLAELKPLDNRITAAGVTLLRERFGKRVRIY